MKKIILYLTLILSCGNSFAQTINTKFPVGKYKMTFEGVVFNLYMDENDRFGLEIKEIEPSNNDSDPEVIIVKGAYAMNEGIITLHPDPAHSKFSVQYKRSDDIEEGKLKLNISGFSYYDDSYFVSSGNYPDFEKCVAVDSLYEAANIDEDEFEQQSVSVSINKGDSLYIIKKSYSRYEIVAFPVPQDGNEFLIRKASDRDSFIPETLMGRKGENENELILFTDSNRSRDKVELFFIGNDIDTRIITPTSFTTEPGYTLWNEYVGRKIDREYDEESSDTEIAEALPVISENIAEYKSYKDARKTAIDENKYLILHYDENNEEYSSADLFVENLNRYDKVAEFNRYFILHEIAGKDKNIPEKFQADRSPGIAIIANGDILLYKETGKSLNTIFNEYLCYSPQFVYNLLERHYAATVSAPALKGKKDPSRKDAERYLSLFSQDKAGDFDYYLRNIEDGREDPDATRLKTDIDTTLIVHLLNSLIKDHYAKEKPDSSSITLVKDVLSYVHRTEEADYHTADYAYPLIENGRFTPAYEYLVGICEKYPLQAEQHNIFVFVNNQIENIDNYSSDPTLKTISYYLFAGKASSLLMLEIPLLIKEYTNSEPKTLNFDSDIDNVVSVYLTTVGNDIEQRISELFEDSYKSRKKELTYVLSQTGYSDIYYDDEEIDLESPEVKDLLKTSYRNMIAGQLNNVAWYNYQYVSLENPELLNRSLAWSEASVKLDPDNPYYLDTYARLLYRLGRRQEAIEKQEAANARSEEIDNISTRREMRDALIRMKNDTLW